MFDYFNKEKSDFLRKKDKSKKGCIDKPAVKIVNAINSKKLVKYANENFEENKRNGERFLRIVKKNIFT